MARYKNAEEILPAHLLREVQRYVQGVELYIPRTRREGWGQANGYRAAIAERNAQMRKLYKAGRSIESLMSEFHLSFDTVRKVVHSRPKTAGVGTSAADSVPMERRDAGERSR